MYDTPCVMRVTVLIAVSLAVLAAAMTAGPAARAGGRVPGFGPAFHPGPAVAVQQGMLPLDRVLPAVNRAVPGRVLDVQVVGAAYRVKVLTANGRVAHVLVDGRSGQIMRVE